MSNLPPSERIQTQAAVCRQFANDLSIETVFLSPPKENEVCIKMVACGICHSDITLCDGGWGGQLPFIAGHEAAGIVIATGQKSKFQIGERVMATLIRYCGQCSNCQNGAPALCEYDYPSPTAIDESGEPVFIGLNTGAFATHIVVHDSQVSPLPDTIDFNIACLLSCGGLTGWGSVTHIANPPAHASIAVVGCGGVGLHCVQTAAMTSPSVLLAIDLSPSKLESARFLGATHALPADDETLLAQAKKLTHERGFDYVLMAAGHSDAIKLSLKLLAPLGTMVLVGMQKAEDCIRLDTTSIAHFQQKILGSKMGGVLPHRDIPTLLQQCQNGQFKVEHLTGPSYPFNQINQALQAAKCVDNKRVILTF